MNSCSCNRMVNSRFPHDSNHLSCSLSVSLYSYARLLIPMHIFVCNSGSSPISLRISATSNFGHSLSLFQSPSCVNCGFSTSSFTFDVEVNSSGSLLVCSVFEERKVRLQDVIREIQIVRKSGRNMTRE